MSRTVIGVMGPGDGAKQREVDDAYELGKRLAEKGWVVLSGGRNAGVMDAVSRGAKEGGGLVIGVLLGEDKLQLSESVDVAIITGMGSARNNINVLSSDVVVACGDGAGTASEIALAIKAGKQVVLLGVSAEGQAFFRSIGESQITTVDTPEEAVQQVQGLLA